MNKECRQISATLLLFFIMLLIGCGNTSIASPNSYTLTYDKNGASSGNVPASVSVIDGESVTVLGNSGSLTLRGYSFGGWNTAQNGNGTNYESGDNVTLTTDLILYARWIATSSNNSYTVSYNANDADSGIVPSSVLVDAGSSTIILGNTGALVRSGYIFDGWNTAKDGNGTDYAIGMSIIPTTDVILYAQWTSTGGSTGGPTDNKPSDYEYTITDGKVTITKYTGSEASVTVPDTIEGYPVTVLEAASDSSKGVFSELSVTSLTLPGSLLTIGDYAFYGCTKLSSLSIPDSVTAIGKEVFEDCSTLAFITIPNSVIAIGLRSFSGCSGLTSITLSNQLESIGYYEFAGCAKLASITIPNSVISIGEGAFFYCNKLSTISMPNSLTTIGQEAFEHCLSLETIDLPSSLSKISYRMFYGCTGLKYITIADSLNTIDAGAFNGCTGLSTITLPATLSSIEDGAFYNCTTLQDFTIPSSVAKIAANTFSGCTALRSITIPSSVTTIVNRAFERCSSLSSVSLPSSVATIAPYAFFGCTGLLSVYVNRTSSPTLGTMAFNADESTILTCKIYVPASAYSSYRLNWSAYAPIIFSM
jgi:uncharacterized repeat protein (TIGR02543 family)